MHKCNYAKPRIRLHRGRWTVWCDPKQTNFRPDDVFNAFDWCRRMNKEKAPE